MLRELPPMMNNLRAECKAEIRPQGVVSAAFSIR
jgi:hypothetical protein